jgi:hypothetical protein
VFQQGLPRRRNWEPLWPPHTMLPMRILQLCLAARSPFKVLMMLGARKIPLAVASVRSLIVETKSLFKPTRFRSVQSKQI